MPGRDPSTNPPSKDSKPAAKRGADISLPQIEMIEASYKKARADYPGLARIGYSKLVLPPSIKRTAARKVLSQLKNGATSKDIAQSKAESRKWAKNRKTGTKNAKKVKKLLSKDNRSSVHSQRKMAEILGIGKTTVGRILKNAGISALKHVETTRDAGTKRAKRRRLAREILQLYADGMQTTRIF